MFSLSSTFLISTTYSENILSWMFTLSFPPCLIVCSTMQSYHLRRVVYKFHQENCRKGGWKQWSDIQSSGLQNIISTLHSSFLRKSLSGISFLQRYSDKHFVTGARHFGSSYNFGEQIVLASAEVTRAKQIQPYPGISLSICLSCLVGLKYC